MSDDGRISTYTIFNSDVFFETLKEAEDTLQYVQEKTSNTNYKIYKLGLLV